MTEQTERLAQIRALVDETEDRLPIESIYHSPKDDHLAHLADSADYLLDLLAEKDSQIERLNREAEKDCGALDQFHELADRLAYSIADMDEIGEHSSANDPWENAIEAAGRLHASLAEKDATIQRINDLASIEYNEEQCDWGTVAVRDLRAVLDGQATP